jgi:lipopolysaccharide/colanic/teichoic acid biosynthesis glycosyltransferase
MHLDRPRPLSSRFSTRLSFELVSTWIVAVLLPCVAWQAFAMTLDIPATNITSLVSANFAVILSVWFSRNFSRYPGIRGGSHIIGASFSGYSIVAVLMLFTRAGYSISILASSFIIATTWLVVLNIAFERKRMIRIGLVPTGAARRLNIIPGVEWYLLSEYKPIYTLTAVAADFHSDISPEWERCLTDYALAGIPVYHFKQLIESLTGRVELDHLSENSFGSLIPSIGYIKMKILIDRIIALIVLVLISPILLIVGAMIRFDSTGPAIFRQQRMGFRGEPFTIYKFRTMHVAPHGDDLLASSMTKHADARITRLGSLLRRSRIDELPQLANIVKGEMSWIGPRPEAAPLSKLYENKIPFYRYRHIVPPGITGWAQINQGHVTSVEDVRLKLDYDFYYVKNVSLWLDIVITVRTAVTIITGRGAV